MRYKSSMTDPTADDLLLRPTIQVPLAGHPPWRLSSQGYVALFGGLLAGTVVGVVSAGRLGAGTGRRVLMVVLCVVGLAVTVTLAIALNRALTASVTMPVDVGGATTRVTVAQPSGTTTYIR